MMHPNKNFLFKVKEAKVTDQNNKVRTYVTIVLEDQRNNFFITHPVTDFIRTRYATTKDNSNTQKAPAEFIKRFLNWLLIENYETYQLKSFEDLQIKHGVDYLNYLANERNNKRNTIKTADRYLTEFYHFLYTKKILPESMKPIVRSTPFGDTVISPFLNEGVEMPNRGIDPEKITDFQDRGLIRLLIETAAEVAPEIAFGIYLQVFGGLRRAEVVNLNRAAIQSKGAYGIKGLTAVVDDRPELFERLRDLSKERVKNPRKQPIYIDGMLPFLYRNHIELLERGKSNNPHNPLFLDEDGNAMSGAVYERRFKKVKKAFLKKLESVNHPEFSVLTKLTWGTHIGRGIYTNLMASVVKSPMELAILRGDKTLTAALSYMSKIRIHNEVNQGLEDLIQLDKVNQLQEDYKLKYSNPNSDSTNVERQSIIQSIKLNI